MTEHATGYEMRGNTIGRPTDDKQAQQMERFANELQKPLRIQGMEVATLGGEIVDPTEVIKSIVSLILATT